jgi:hypothetical protein
LIEVPVLGSISQLDPDPRSGLKGWLSLGGYAAALSALVMVCGVLFLLQNQAAEFGQALLSGGAR